MARDPQVAEATISVHGTIRDAMRAIGRGGLGLALLVDPESERFAGLVTDGDLRRALLGGLGLDAALADVRRPEPKTARLGMTPEEISALFTEPVRVVPVLDDEGRIADVAMFDRRVRLPVAEPLLGEQELLYVAECVLTGWVSSAGSFIERFERAFADFCGTKHAVAVSNGTAALHLALLALGIGSGDEVIVPTLTFIATANAVSYTGASPVMVDSEPNTWTIDPDAVGEAISPRTRAIVPVHLYGHPADLDPLLEVAARHGLGVVEDAAEAHGARYKGRPVGGLGDAGIFSFYGNKIVTTGEGGMVTTNDAAFAERIRLLRAHGMSGERRYWHPVLGYNYRLTNLQAALGVAQLERIEEIIRRKRKVADVYGKGLGNVRGISLPPEAPWAYNVYWLYSVLVDERETRIGRDAMVEALAREGLETRPIFPPLHTQPIYETGTDLPVAARIAATGLSLPSSAALTERSAGHVVDVVRALTEARAGAAVP